MTSFLRYLACTPLALGLVASACTTTESSGADAQQNVEDTKADTPAAGEKKCQDLLSRYGQFDGSGQINGYASEQDPDKELCSVGQGASVCMKDWDPKCKIAKSGSVQICASKDFLAFSACLKTTKAYASGTAISADTKAVLGGYVDTNYTPQAIQKRECDATVTVHDANFNFNRGGGWYKLTVTDKKITSKGTCFVSANGECSPCKSTTYPDCIDSDVHVDTGLYTNAETRAVTLKATCPLRKIDNRDAQ